MLSNNENNTFSNLFGINAPLRAEIEPIRIVTKFRRCVNLQEVSDFLTSKVYQSHVVPPLVLYFLAETGLYVLATDRKNTSPGPKSARFIWI